MKLNKYLLALTCALTATAHADSSGFYIAGSVGQSRFNLDWDKSDADALLDDVGLTVNSSKLDKHDSAYKIQFGYQFNEYFAVEGGYIDLGAAEYKATVNGGASGKAEYEATGINVGAVAIMPLTSSFSLLAKFGFIRSDVDFTLGASAGGVSASESESGNNVDTYVAFGAQYAFTDNFAVRAEFDNYNNIGDDDKTGEAKVKLLSLGAVLKF